MESPISFPRYTTPQNSKKRTLPGGGSSSAACEEGEGLEMSPPPMDRSSKPKCLKHKEVPEVIDVDMEEDCDDASLMDTEVDGSAKGKKVLSSVGISGSADEDSEDDVATSNDDAAELEDLEDLNDDDDDLGSGLYFGEDEWTETDYDNMIFDDNDHLEAHFDNMELPPGVEASVPWFQDTPKNEAKGPSTSTYAASSLRTGAKHVVDEMVHKYENFAKFDMADDYSDHHYANRLFPKETPKNWSKRIQEEWKVLEKDLPAMIYVRAYESRMDLMRAVIIGAEGTPYHDGLFFFDVYFPSSYPHTPPEVHYHSGGLRINPNLYNCGKVCLSLLNTWSGRGKEKWVAEESTILQVLVSIQGLILNKNPFFNEPGYEGQMGSKHGEVNSAAYNETTFMDSLKTMIYSMQRPPKHFEDFVVGYFRMQARYILVSCIAYLNGSQVGCLVRGGVRDIDNTEQKSCSEKFKIKLREFINTLVNKFLEIGADGCKDYLAYATKDCETGVEPATAADDGALT